MKRIICLFMCLFIVFNVGCTKKEEQQLENTKQVSSKIEKIDETISLIALGDNLLHMPVINDGKKEDGSYDYSHIFKNLQPMIKDADVAIIGQETVFGGQDLGYSGYPLFNSPSDMGKTLVNEGFDIVLHASNHVLDKGKKGLLNTINFWKDYPSVTVLGVNETEEEYNDVEIIEVKGARIAVLNYTYSTNGIPIPSDMPYMVNMIDRQKIEKDVIFANENADFTIAFMHWGTEYSTKPDSMQKELSSLMCSWGVDLIIGSHPHVIEPVEWIESENGNKMLVYYSLGNFVSRQLEAINLLGGIAKINFHYDGEKVTIKDDAFMPIVTHYDSNYSSFGVYPLKEYSDDLAKDHGVRFHNGNVSVKRYRDMVDKVFDGYSANIDY